MGIDTVTPRPEVTQTAEPLAPINELIAVAETIPQIIALAKRIRREQPGGTEWSDLHKQARLIIDGYVQQVQADPNQLSRLRQEVANLTEISLLDVTDLKTYVDKLTAAAAKTG